LVKFVWERKDDPRLFPCSLRSGLLVYQEEEEVRRLADTSFFLADTNVFVNLGDRLGEVTRDRRRGRRLLASRSVYNELLSKTLNTQRGDPRILFHLAMASYRNILTPPVTSEHKGSGDVSLIKEAVNLKSQFPERLVLLTCDKGLSNSAYSQGVIAVLLNWVRRGGWRG
jgi:hypothetical protein